MCCCAFGCVRCQISRVKRKRCIVSKRSAADQPGTEHLQAFGWCPELENPPGIWSMFLLKHPSCRLPGLEEVLRGVHTLAEPPSGKSLLQAAKQSGKGDGSLVFSSFETVFWAFGVFLR